MFRIMMIVTVFVAIILIGPTETPGVQDTAQPHGGEGECCGPPPLCPPSCG